MRAQLSRYCTYAFLLAVMATCTSCTNSGTPFSQLPGFAAYFATVPNGSATQAERALLEQYKPHHYLARGQTRPIDFYQDYIANGTLHKCNSATIISTQVTQAELNRYKNDPNLCFRYTGSPQPQNTPDSYPLYGRVDYAELAGKRLTFLSYNLVFATSGILKGIPWYKSLPLWLLGSLTDWHQLDNYIMACVMLNSKEQPIALMLQQHNYMTTYLPFVHLPQDNWWQVDIAQRSNELYPHHPTAKKHRAVSFLTPASLDFMLGQTSVPTMGGFDQTHGEERLPTKLVFLPREDALYRFVGMLGEKRLLPGRSAPPGAEFNTLPGFKPLALSLISSYRRPGKDEEYKRIFTSMFKGLDTTPSAEYVQALTERFINDLHAHDMTL